MERSSAIDFPFLDGTVDTAMEASPITEETLMPDSTDDFINGGISHHTGGFARGRPFLVVGVPLI